MVNSVYFHFYLFYFSDLELGFIVISQTITHLSQVMVTQSPRT